MAAGLERLLALGRSHHLDEDGAFDGKRDFRERRACCGRPVNAARRLKPSVKWDAASLVRADVTCDGKADGILLGRDNSTVWAAVISSDKPEVNRRNLMQFALGPGTQAALCALPATIETYPIECETESGPLEGCKPSPSCRGFSVVDGQCDSLHFYWHSGLKRIVWWRR